MRSTRKSWKSKLRPELEPSIVDCPRGTGLLLIPTPLLVAEEMSRIEKGEVASPAAIRARLATRFGVERCCPLVTGIFVNIVAGAAEEDVAAGSEPLAPWWRVVPEGGLLNPKVVPGTERQAMLLAAEGHTVARDERGRWRVQGGEAPPMSEKPECSRRPNRQRRDPRA